MPWEAICCGETLIRDFQNGLSPVGAIGIDWGSYGARPVNASAASDQALVKQQTNAEGLSDTLASMGELLHHRLGDMTADLAHTVRRLEPPLQTGVKKVTDNLASTLREYGADDLAKNVASLVGKPDDYNPVAERGELNWSDGGDAFIEELPGLGLSFALMGMPPVGFINGYTQAYGPLKEKRRENNGNKFSYLDEALVQTLALGNGLLEGSSVGPIYRAAKPAVVGTAALAKKALRKLAAEPLVNEGLVVAERAAEKALAPVRDVVLPAFSEGADTVGQVARKAVADPIRNTVDNVLQSEPYRLFDDKVVKPTSRIIEHMLDSNAVHSAAAIGREAGAGASEGAAKAIAQTLGESAGTDRDVNLDPVKLATQGAIGALGEIAKKVPAPLRTLVLPSLGLGRDTNGPPEDHKAEAADDPAKQMAKRVLLLRSAESTALPDTLRYIGRQGGRRLVDYSDPSQRDIVRLPVVAPPLIRRARAPHIDANGQ